MKKNIVFIFIFITITGVVTTLVIKQIRLASFDAVLPQTSRDEVLLKAGKKEAKLSYGELGVSIDAGTAVLKPAGGLGLASLLLSNRERAQDSVGIAVDHKLLTYAIMSIFPFLSSPEEAHSSFFIISADQKIKSTFNLRKLVADLSDKAFGLRKSAIEVEIIPSEEFETKRKELAGKEVTVKLEGDDVPTLKWQIGADSVLDKEKLKAFIENEIVSKVNRQVKHAIINQFNEGAEAVYAVVDGLAQDGVSIPVEENMKRIREAVLRGELEVFLEPLFETSYVFNQTGIDMGAMRLLAVGRSNFAGSPEGRSFNIQKGLREKINNIIVPPGAKFAFNGFLGKITAAAGWKKALGIFGGGSLAPTLGGGLCQVSTTVYRAALLAGLTVTERKAHSLYVKYYKEFGEGLDSTIYSTGPNLIFLNDTPSYIFIQSYVDRDDAYVKLFGTSDGRKTKLEGPYRSHDIPVEKGYKPPINEIVWFRVVKWLDGNKREEMITSRYKALPWHPA